ncbi:MAG: sensor histidine kinase [Faecousia sp.]
MKKLGQWIGSLNATKKLIFYGYLTLAPVMVLVTVVLMLVNYGKVQNEQLDLDLRAVKAVSDSIGVIQTEIKDFTTYLCINNQVRMLVTDDDTAQKNKNARVWEEDTPLQLIQDVLSLKGYIKTIAIYPENGVRPYLRGMDGSVHISELAAVRRQDVYAAAQENKYHYIWRCVPRDSGEVYLVNREDKIVLCREMYDLSKETPLAFLVIGISRDYFQDLYKNLIHNHRESALILSADGVELDSSGDFDEKVHEYLLSEEFFEQIESGEAGFVPYGNVNIVYMQQDEKSSVICKVVPKYNGWEQIKDIAYMPLMLLLGVLLGMLPLLLIISRLYTKPLRQVSDAIRKFSAGDFTQKVEVNTSDEVGEVADCFNHMVEDIKRLIDENYVIRLQEKESELALLQAQINPHFLYNTLDSLYWLAMEKDNDELAESILALSQLFRLVLSQGRAEIPVENEIELVSCYLQIHKIRFSRRLNYQIRLSDGVRHVKIPKLIVQPFVENAIVHGLDQVDGVCEVTVSAVQEGNFVRFEITDTGIGMTQEQLDGLWKTETAQYANHRIGRYAIRNIRERLQLRYQDRFRLDIRSAVGKGTTVVLMIPFEED